MGLFDTLIWLTLTGIIGGSIGVVASKLALRYEKKQDIKKVFEIIEGKKLNTFKLDGEIIDINEFTYKDNSGKLFKKVTLSDIVKKSPQKPLKDEKTPLRKVILRKLKDKFVWKKVEEKPLKVPEIFSFKDKKGKKITLHAKKIKRGRKND